MVGTKRRGEGRPSSCVGYEGSHPAIMPALKPPRDFPSGGFFVHEDGQKGYKNT